MDDTFFASALIAGRSKLSRRALREAVSSECCRVIEACDAAEAYELGRRYVPDVIVLSDEDGMDKIRRDQELASVPVICIDGTLEPGDLSARVRAALHR